MGNYKIEFTLRLDPETHYKINKIAKEENRKMSNMILRLIEKEIKSYEAENGAIKVPEEISLKSDTK